MLLKAQNFSDGQAARAAIGQISFTYANSTPGPQILGGASGIAYANGMLFVADSNRVGALPQNNRVLMFNTTQIPGPLVDLITFPRPNPYCGLCGYVAENVLGQPTYSCPSAVCPAGVTSTAMTTPTAVATDGNILAVADTDNNRVLLWNSIPTTINVPASIVLGQPNFTSSQATSAITAQTMRGPQGVWIQNGKLFVADTQNFRVLIWNHIPTQNGQPADLELGQPNFNSANQPSGSNPTVAANQLLSPTSVTSDGIRFYVADLGNNRVLIWNSIPTAMDQPADVVVGQPNLTTSVPNNSAALCPSNGTNSSGQPNYPDRCEYTLDFPRFALSDGTRLFIADGGNDRVLIYNSIPTTNGAPADGVLGQPDFRHDVVTSQSISTGTGIGNAGSVDTFPSPTSLAFDGTNLYVSDPNDRRVLVFSPGNTFLPPQSIVNHASEIIRQEGTVAISGTIVAKDTVTITIAGTAYTYTVLSSDTLATIAQGLVNAINAGKGDPNVTALIGPVSGVVYLSSKQTNLPFDAISLTAAASNANDLTVVTSGGYLSAGTAATVAPGTIVEINGTNLSDNNITQPLSGALQLVVGGTEVDMDGLPVPVWSVSPTQVIAQVPYSFSDRTSSSVYVHTVHNDGSVTATTASPITIAPANPGLFGAPAYFGEPRPWPAAGATHEHYNPAAVVSIDGTATAGNTVTITVNGRAYTYTVVAGDTLATIAEGLITLINKRDTQVAAFFGGAYARVLLISYAPGAAGSGIPIAASVSSGASETATAYTSATCCAVVPFSPITTTNPAVPGEIISVPATGLGLLSDSPSIVNQIAGYPYQGPQPNSAYNGVSATVNGTTAQVLKAGLDAGSYGVYDVQIVLPTTLPTKSDTQVYIAQNNFLSNIVTIPVGPAASGSGGSNSAGVTFTAMPEYISPAPGTNVGSTTLTWSGAPGVVLVYAGDPANNGQLLAQGASSGSAQANGFLTNGMTFYLQDATNISPTSSAATLATVIVHVETHVIGDFDGDGKADLSVWRPLTGTWYIVPSSTNVPYSVQWGLPGDTPIIGDFDGDGKTDLTVWRPSIGTWFFVLTSDPNPFTYQWGVLGDVPVTGDFDGIGKDEMAVWRGSNGTWWVIPGYNPGAPIITTWGVTGDIPVPADYDGDGKTDFAIWRPSTGAWWIVPSSTGVPYTVQWGVPGDTPISADFDGDGKADVAVWRPSTGTWWIIPSKTGISYTQQWGLPGDVPLALDFDGDGKADLTVWRPTTGTWFIIPSSTGVSYSQQWGLPGDVPN